MGGQGRADGTTAPGARAAERAKDIHCSHLQNPSTCAFVTAYEVVLLSSFGQGYAQHEVEQAACISRRGLKTAAEAFSSNTILHSPSVVLVCAQYPRTLRRICNCLHVGRMPATEASEPMRCMQVHGRLSIVHITKWLQLPGTWPLLAGSRLHGRCCRALPLTPR